MGAIRAFRSTATGRDVNQASFILRQPIDQVQGASPLISVSHSTWLD
jgi:hypothetical protein